LHIDSNRAKNVEDIQSPKYLSRLIWGLFELSTLTLTGMRGQWRSNEIRTIF